MTTITVEDLYQLKLDAIDLARAVDSFQRAAQMYADVRKRKEQLEVEMRHADEEMRKYYSTAIQLKASLEKNIQAHDTIMNVVADTLERVGMIEPLEGGSGGCK